MSPDLYGAWLTAGNNLQPAVAWVARNWPNLAAAILLAVFAALCIRHACHDLAAANRRVNAALAELDQPRKENQP